MLTLLFVYFVVRESSFVLVIVAVIGCYRTICVLGHFRRHRSSSFLLSSLLFGCYPPLCVLRRSRGVVPRRHRCRRCCWRLPYCVLHCADRSHTLPRGISPLWDHESPIICRGNVEITHCHCHPRLLIFACHHQ